MTFDAQRFQEEQERTEKTSSTVVFHSSYSNIVLTFMSSHPEDEKDVFKLQKSLNNNQKYCDYDVICLCWENTYSSTI